MKTQPEINEMIALLEKLSPESIQNIRNDYPEHQNILKLGIVLGRSERPNELKVRAEVCHAYLEVILSKSKEEIVLLKLALKKLNLLKYYGLIINAVSSAGVVIALTSSYKKFAIIPGVLSLFGILLQLYVEYKIKGLDKSKQLDTIYSELVKLSLEAEQNKNELNFFLSYDFNEQKVAEIVSRSNQQCTDISVLLSII